MAVSREKEILLLEAPTSLIRVLGSLFSSHSVLSIILDPVWRRNEGYRENMDDDKDAPILQEGH